ncbi:hypothetical protein LTR17_019159 [Elasticomyces elasticus]|nr:hypothetical protein LTR17_019159 [Elasticomyces elasticus]
MAQRAELTLMHRVPHTTNLRSWLTRLSRSKRADRGHAPERRVLSDQERHEELPDVTLPKQQLSEEGAGADIEDFLIHEYGSLGLGTFLHGLGRTPEATTLSLSPPSLEYSPSLKPEQAAYSGDSTVQLGKRDPNALRSAAEWPMPSLLSFVGKRRSTVELSKPTQYAPYEAHEPPLELSEKKPRYLYRRHPNLDTINASKFAKVSLPGQRHLNPMFPSLEASTMAGPSEADPPCEGHESFEAPHSRFPTSSDATSVYSTTTESPVLGWGSSVPPYPYENPVPQRHHFYRSSEEIPVRSVSSLHLDAPSDKPFKVVSHSPNISHFKTRTSSACPRNTAMDDLSDAKDRLDKLLSLMGHLSDSDLSHGHAEYDECNSDEFSGTPFVGNLGPVTTLAPGQSPTSNAESAQDAGDDATHRSAAGGGHTFNSSQGLSGYAASSGERGYAIRRDDGDGGPGDFDRRKRSRTDDSSELDGVTQVCCFIDGCPGRDTYRSGLLIKAGSHHALYICPRCYDVFASAAVLEEHKKEIPECVPRCLSATCVGVILDHELPQTSRGHAKTKNCSQDQRTTLINTWRYLYKLGYPDRTIPDPEFVGGQPKRHLPNNGRLPRPVRATLNSISGPTQALEEARDSLRLAIQRVENERIVSDLHLQLSAARVTADRAVRLENIIAALLSKLNGPVEKWLLRMIETDAPGALTNTSGSAAMVQGCLAQASGLVTPDSLPKDVQNGRLDKEMSAILGSNQEYLQSVNQQTVMTDTSSYGFDPDMEAMWSNPNLPQWPLYNGDTTVLQMPGDGQGSQVFS